MRSDIGGRPLGYHQVKPAGEVDQIWQIIRQIRLARGLSIRDLAAMAKVAPSTVSRGERGYRIWLSCTRAVVEALGMEVVVIYSLPPENLPETIDEVEIFDASLPEAA